ncbi:MAG: hypothetical protein V2A62_04710 [Candidatus Woesearchaeota archaeon]
MIYEEDYCELFEEELALGSGEKTAKYCELCELQRANEKMVTEVMGVDMKDVKNKMLK